MIKVRKANKIVSVSENELDKYLTKGYYIIEERQPSAQVVDNPTYITEETETVVKKPQQKKRRNTK